MFLPDTTIKSILAALKMDGIKTGDVAKAIEGISEKPFRAALKAAGYEFSNRAPKGWHYVGAGEEPLDKSIFDYVKQGNLQVKRNSSKVHTNVSEGELHVTLGELGVRRGELAVNSISSTVPLQFTSDEVNMILEMLQEWRNSKEDINVLEAKPSVHERVKRIPQGEKTRKTIVIDKAIGERLDVFCEQERLNKSDVMYLALEAFLDGY